MRRMSTPPDLERFLSRRSGAAGTSRAFVVDRRQILRGGLALGAGLVLGLRVDPASASASEDEGPGIFAPNAFVRIAPDDTVTVLSKHIEFGQGTYTGLATLVAEELDADWSTVRVEAAPADVKLYANILFGIQGTGGSTAMPSSWQQMRQAGATARALLVAAAAAAWSVPAAEIEVREGVVRHAAAGKSARFGELAEAAAKLEPPTEVKLKDPKDYVFIGRRDLPRLDVPAKSRGEARFGFDEARPGQLTALIARPPRFGAAASKVDAAAAEKVPGVVHVVEVPRGVAVLAENFWAAKKGRDALEITWDESAAEVRGSEEIFAEYRALLDESGAEVRQDGDPETALEDAAKIVEADFEFPYLAHAPMEPLSFTIELGADSCEAWAGSQLQTIDHGTVAAIVGLPPEKVRLHTLYGGGSFGRRATPDADVASEAASIAKAVRDADPGPGKTLPIKLLWTREDDIRGGKYRPAYVHRLRAGLDEGGKIVAWTHRIVGQSILQGTAFEAALVKDGIDESSVEGAKDLPYAIANLGVDLHTTKVGVPVLWWRSVGHSHNAYSTETFLDELARAAGRDPVEMRRELLQDAPRHLGVLNLAAEKAGWGDPVPAGRARGVAVHSSFGSYVAQVVEISKGKDGLPWVHRVVCAVDCGVAINPDIIAAQMESGIGYGLGAALHDEIVLEKGRVRESNFHNYRSLRLHEMPEVEVHIVKSGESPTGVGEPGVPPIAPAVANAWATLTGESVRRLPFRRSIGTGS